MNKLEEIRKSMQDCQACALCKTRNMVVFGRGSAKPLLMIVGEAPGESEDQEGVPFLGDAGDKLDRILKYIGVSRDEIYITNSVLCRTPNARDPLPEELLSCRLRLEKEVAFLKPKLIIALGKVAAQQLQGKPIRGRLSRFFPENAEELDGLIPVTLGGHETKVLVTYHPSYLLKNPKRGYKAVLPHWTKVKLWIEYEKR